MAICGSSLVTGPLNGVNLDSEISLLRIRRETVTSLMRLLVLGYPHKVSRCAESRIRFEQPGKSAEFFDRFADGTVHRLPDVLHADTL